MQRSNVISTFSAILIGALASGAVQAAVIHVPSDQPTVAAGLSVASEGDVVLVACGEYLEFNLALPSGITLRGDSSDPSCVVINAEGAGRVLLASDLSVGSVIENITLRNGAANAGAGLDVDTSTVTVVNCHFDGNHASAFGGGLYANESVVVVEQCRFTGNSTDHDGGGLDVVRSTFLITDSYFEGNSAEYGGGMVVGLNESSTIQNCTFIDNQALVGGGAFTSAVGGSPLISYCFFKGNSAQDGGAIFALMDNGPSVDHCTIVENSASQGAGLYAWQTTFTFTNSIVAFSTEGEAVFCFTGGGINTFCCDFYGNAGGDWIGCVEPYLGILGNISEDPYFCLSDFPSEPYTLSASSSCVDLNNPECGQIGAFGMGCGFTSTESSSWSRVKSMY